jgi:hypothetical protein
MGFFITRRSSGRFLMFKQYTFLVPFKQCVFVDGTDGLVHGKHEAINYCKMIEHNLFAGLLIVLVDGTSHVINIIGKVPSRSIKI